MITAVANETTELQANCTQRQKMKDRDNKWKYCPDFDPFSGRYN